MARVSDSETYLSRHYIRPAIRRTVFAGSQRTAQGERYSLETPSSMEVCGSYYQQNILTASALGCGRFFEGTAQEMHTALNKTLASLPNDTKVFVCFHLPISRSP